MERVYSYIVLLQQLKQGRTNQIHALFFINFKSLNSTHSRMRSSLAKHIVQ